MSYLLSVYSLVLLVSIGTSLLFAVLSVTKQLKHCSEAKVIYQSGGSPTVILIFFGLQLTSFYYNSAAVACLLKVSHALQTYCKH